MGFWDFPDFTAVSKGRDFRPCSSFFFVEEQNCRYTHINAYTDRAQHIKISLFFFFMIHFLTTHIVGPS
jgi:hypothetical protein